MRDFMARLLDLELEIKQPFFHANVAGAIVAQALMDAYEDELGKRDSRKLRLSTLGYYSPLEVGAIYFSRVNPDRDFSRRLRRLLLDGALFEAQLYWEFQLMGYKVLDMQTEVTWNGVTGHADYIVEDHTKQAWVVDAKTCHDWYFKSVVNHHLDNSKGYLTQIGTYSNSLGLPSAFVFKNKDNSEVAVLLDNGEIHRHVNALGNPTDVSVKEIPSIPGMIVSALKDAETLLIDLREVGFWEELFAIYQPPTPSMEMKQIYGRDPETNKRFKIGEEPVLDDNGSPKLYAPSSIKFPELFYELYDGVTSYGKKRQYVSNYKYPPGYEEYMPDINTIYEDWLNVTSFED